MKIEVKASWGEHEFLHTSIQNYRDISLIRILSSGNMNKTSRYNYYDITNPDSDSDSEQVGRTAFSVALTFLHNFNPNLNKTVIFLV